MIVAHRDKPATLQYQAGRQEVVETDQGRVRQVVRSRTITFKTMEPGIKTNKIPTGMDSDGRLKSFIDTEVEAERLGISHDELIRFLESHPSFNERFIFVDEDSTQVVGDEEGFGDGITKAGDGSYQCIACDKFIRDGRGLAGHKKSKAHLENLAALRDGEAAQVA